MKVKFAIIILLILASIVKAKVNNATFRKYSESDLVNDYITLDKQLRLFVDRGVKRLLPFALQVGEHVNVSATCMDNLFQLMNGIRKLTEWSINYLDAVGKPQSGILLGNMQMYGEYRQCFETVVKKKDKLEFRGQYCAVSLKPIMPYFEKIHVKYQFKELSTLATNSSGLLKTLIHRLSAISILDPKIGLCVPSGCTKNDMSQIFHYISEKTYYLNATVAYCVKEEDLFFWTKDRIIVSCVFAFIGLLILTSTIIDLFIEEKEHSKLGLATRILLCFSITRNFPKLINTNTSEETITCFYGIRVLSVFWIVLCHEYLMQGAGLVANHGLDVLEFIKGFFNQIVLNGFTSTEIFFLLGGFVNCYVRTKIKLSGKPQPSVLKMMIHRLWRIYPTYIVAFLIFVLLSTTGPQFHEGTILVQDVCRKNWWRNILFINNFFELFDTCLPHTWYVAVDMQMFLFSLITVPILLRHEKIGILLHSGIIIFVSIGCFMLWWIRNLPPSPVDQQKFSITYVNSLTQVYFNPIVHIASYYIGLLLGYVVATKKEKKFSKVTLFWGWLIASFFYLSMLFLTYRWNSGTLYSQIESSLYGSLSKPILILCVSWLIYCCKTGQGGVVNYFLSLKLWIPLSRLTYMVYMISILIQTFHNANVNFPTDFATLYLLWSYFGDLSVSLLMSFVLVLAVESPFLSLEKIIFRRNQEEKKSSSEFQKDVTSNGNKESENPNMKTVEI